MNPTVEAAWIAVFGVIIGVGGTVVVAIAGFKSSRDATKAANDAGTANVRAQIEADRLSRIWEERAKIYSEVLAAVEFRQVRRHAEAKTDPADQKTKRQLDAILATFNPPDWHALEARSLALSSELVISATQRSSTAELRCQAAMHDWQSLRAMSATVDQVKQMAGAVAAARQAADDADDALVEAIRTELIGHGPPLADWQPTT